MPVGFNGFREVPNTGGMYLVSQRRVENLEWVTGLENTRRAFMRLKEKKGGGLNGIC